MWNNVFGGHSTIKIIIRGQKMRVKEDIHSQIIKGLADATFPIDKPKDLLASSPPGKVNTLPNIEYFPFESARQINDIIVEICENGPAILNEITFLDHAR